MLNITANLPPRPHLADDIDRCVCYLWVGDIMSSRLIRPEAPVVVSDDSDDTGRFAPQDKPVKI